MRYLLLLTFLLGTTAVFAERKKAANRDFYDFGDSHIITFTPISGIVAFDNFNPGAGFDYELILSRKLGIGIHIPVMLGYEGPDQTDFGGSYYTRHTSFFTAPGIRFHTGSRNGTIDFSTGPSILIGNMHFRQVNDYGNPVVQEPYDYSMVGLLADNTISFSRNHFVFGFNVRVGSMIDRHEDTRFFMQFGMQFGGKF